MLPLFLSAIEVGKAPDEIQLLPYGMVNSKHGPILNDEIAMQEIISLFNSQVNEMVIDYEHQTLYGGEAPAAGWITEMINKGEQGLWAKVTWTERAKQYIENKEYRYLSPVVWVRQSDGRAIEIQTCALTNMPAIDGMVPLINTANNRPFAWVPPEHLQNRNNEKGADHVKFLLALKTKLGLPEAATEEEVLGAVEKLQNQEKTLVANKEVLSLLELNENASLDETKGKIIALKNPAGYVSREEYNKLKERLDSKDRDELVQLALSQGKITPAQKQWAEQIALKDPAGFKSFLETAPVVVPLSQLPLVPDNKKKPEVNSEVQLSINKQLGISQELVDKYNQEQ
jgi:phage I-like protein